MNADKRNSTAAIGWFLLALPVLPLAHVGSLAAEESDHDIGKLFRDSCQDCHTIPDPAHGTDLAWLRQVNDTA